jgi:alpha-glucosidase
LLTLLLTLPGAAVTYNGDEIGMLDYREISWDETKDLQACNTNDVENYKVASRDPQRTPFQWDGTAYAGFKEAMGSEPWIQVNPNYPTLNLALQKEATKSFYKFYQQLAELRKDEIFVNGMFESRAFSQQVFGYKRTLGGSSYVVLINLGNTSEIVDVNEISAGFPLLTEVVLAGSQSYYGVG